MNSMSRLAFVATVLAAGVGCRSDHPATPPADQAEAASAQGDSNDQLLLATVKTALPPPGISAVDLPEPTTPGAQAVATYCAQCHNLPSPTMHSATDWPSIMRRMWLRMDRLPPSMHIQVPDEGARAQIAEYLTSNALQVSGSSLPPGTGRQEFAMICSRCHSLPDPRIHSPQDWLTVFMRMERNMERMNVSRPSGEQTRLILTYLQNPSLATR